ncbi:unnamed protein product, partial [Rotaria magnacalcarata]
MNSNEKPLDVIGIRIHHISTAASHIDGNSSADGKYHRILIHLIDINSSYAGGFYEPSTKMVNACSGSSVNEIVNQADGALEETMKHWHCAPFDLKKIKESVVFDYVACRTENEMITALQHVKKGTNYEDIIKSIS